MAGTAVTPVYAEQQGKTHLHHWSLTTANTDGVPISFPGAADRVIQVLGTMGGATCILEGSLDGGTTYFGLKDPNGNAVSFTSAGGCAITENCLLIRPRLSVGGSGAAIEVYLLSRATSVY